MSRKTAERKQRIPMNGKRLRLDAPKREGFYSRWINDDVGRLQEAQEAGYDFRLDPTNSDSSDSRTWRHVGGGKRAYLMDLPEEYRNEDVLEAQASIDRKEAAILRKGRVDPSSGHALSNDPTAYVANASVRRGT